MFKFEPQVAKHNLGFGYLDVGISYTTELYISENFTAAAYRREYEKMFYNCYIMTPVEIANMILGIVISVGTIISITAMGVRWLVKHYFDEIKKELKPNSGSSMKDQVTRLEARMDKTDTLRKETYLKVEKLERKLDDMYDKFLDYLSKTNK